MHPKGHSRVVEPVDCACGRRDSAAGVRGLEVLLEARFSRPPEPASGPWDLLPPKLSQRKAALTRGEVRTQKLGSSEIPQATAVTPTSMDRPRFTLDLRAMPSPAESSLVPRSLRRTGHLLPPNSPLTSIRQSSSGNEKMESTSVPPCLSVFGFKKKNKKASQSVSGFCPLDLQGNCVRWADRHVRAQAVGAPEPTSSLSRASTRPVWVGPRAGPRRGHAGLPVGSLRLTSFLMRGSEKLLRVASWRLHFLPFETKPSSLQPRPPVAAV